QGPVTAIGEEVLGPREAAAATDDEPALVEGWIKIRDQQIWLFSGIHQLTHGHGRKFFDRASLHVGQDVGVYTKYYSGARNELAIAYYIDPAPAKPASGKALQPIAEQSSSSNTASFLLFSVVAGLIGLGIGAADGIVCRLPRRAILGGLIGLLVGAVGGLISHVFAGVIYTPITHLASEE